MQLNRGGAVRNAESAEQQRFRSHESWDCIQNGFYRVESGYSEGQARLNDERPDHAVAPWIAELAAALVAGTGTDDVLGKVTSAAVALVAGADVAKLSVIDHGNLRSIAATSHLAVLLDGAQQAGGQGPCLDAISAHIAIRCGDLRTDVRWPQFATSAASAGLRSVLSCPLDAPGATLSLFGFEPEAFAVQSDAIGSMLANHAAIALIKEGHERQFKAALASRDVIGQAKGMIMERLGVEAPHDFAMLKEMSQATNTRVLDFAVEVVNGCKHPS